MGLPLIFQPNSHSQWHTNYRSVETSLGDQLKSLLADHYAIGQILDIQQAAEAEINSNNFKVSTTDGVYLLRRYVGVKDLAIINRTLELMAWLKAWGVKAPTLVFTVKKETVVETTLGPYALFDFIVADHYRGTESELASAGLEIGKLDQALTDLPTTTNWSQALALPTKFQDLRTYDLTIWQDLFNRARRQKELQPEDKFHSQFLAQEDFILQIVAKNLQDRPKAATWGVVHFDLHPHNLLTTGQEVAAIIDFDSLRYLEHLRALAFGLHRLVRQYIIFNQLTDYREGVTKAQTIFLTNYKQVHSLDDSLLGLMPYFIRDEALARFTYAMKDQYLNNNPAWREDLVKQTSNIAEADYFE